MESHLLFLAVYRRFHTHARWLIRGKRKIKVNASFPKVELFCKRGKRITWGFDIIIHAQPQKTLQIGDVTISHRDYPFKINLAEPDALILAMAHMTFLINNCPSYLL